MGVPKYNEKASCYDTYYIRFFKRNKTEQKPHIASFANFFEVVHKNNVEYTAETFSEAVHYLIDVLGQDPRLLLLLDNVISIKDKDNWQSLKRFSYNRREGPKMEYGVNWKQCPPPWSKWNDSDPIQ